MAMHRIIFRWEKRDLMGSNSLHYFRLLCVCILVKRKAAGNLKPRNPIACFLV